MKLSDIMSSMQLSSYAEIALLLFFCAFVAVSVSVACGRDASEWERWRRLPLEPGEGEADTEGAAAP